MLPPFHEALLMLWDFQSVNYRLHILQELKDLFAFYSPNYCTHIKSGGDAAVKA